MSGVLIIGGGLSGQRCAEKLRGGGYNHPITIVSDEPHAPYDRPALSKGILLGSSTVDDLAYRESGWYKQEGIQLILNNGASSLDKEKQQVTLQDGTTLQWDHLVIASGSRARKLPGSEKFSNIQTLRTQDDALLLKKNLIEGKRLVVLGGGLIGQEVASSACQLGLKTTIVEAETLPLARALHPWSASWLVELQKSRGVEVILGTGIHDFVGQNGHLQTIVLENKTRLDLDYLVVSIGVIPNIEWTGQEAHDLMIIPGIHVCGDVAGGNHWESAAASGRAVGAEILEQREPGRDLTAWWSDIHGLRIQGLGQPQKSDKLTVHGDPNSESFHITGSREDKIVTALTINQPREIPRLRKIIAEAAL